MPSEAIRHAVPTDPLEASEQLSNLPYARRNPISDWSFITQAASLQHSSAYAAKCPVQLFESARTTVVHEPHEPMSLSLHLEE